MSGTSLDGIDAALVEIEPNGGSYLVRTLATCTETFGDDLAAGLHRAMPPAAPGPSDVAVLDAALGVALGAAAASVAGTRRVDFVASHGLTIFHDGDHRLTSQIGDPFVIRERVSTTVLFDFRRADCAAGGQGAPLVPFVDALLFASGERARAVVNLGGIANVTLLSPGSTVDEAIAWDTGPANILLDAFVRSRTEGKQSRDDDGNHASRGVVHRDVLQRLLKDPYFTKQPPKSTGREHFGDDYLGEHADSFSALSLEDGCATLTALSAESLAAALHGFAPHGGEAIVSGGGVHNGALMAALTTRLPHWDIASSQRFGVDPDFKEAIAFAVLGYELLRGRTAGLPLVTGARHGSLLGAIVPCDLATLLARLSEELNGAAPQEA